MMMADNTFAGRLKKSLKDGNYDSFMQ